MKKIALYGRFSPNMEKALIRQCPPGFQLTRAEGLEGLGEANYIICRSAELGAGVLEAAPKLRMVQKWGAGYDTTDIQAAADRGIPVAVCLGGNSIPVAELTVALMLSVLRNVFPLSEKLRQGRWAREEYAPRSYLLHGKTVGLVGIGHVARQVARIVRGGFGCQVLYYDLFPLSPEAERELGAVSVPLNQLMAESDIVSIHVPLNPSTAGLIDSAKLALMKPTACLINTSRGGVVNEEDLTAALAEGRILGAGLDTFAVEPPAPDDPLLQMDNVAVTPHCAGNTADNDVNMAAICMENIAQFDSTGDWQVPAVVNRALLKDRRETAL